MPMMRPVDKADLARTLREWADEVENFPHDVYVVESEKTTNVPVFDDRFGYGRPSYLEYRVKLEYWR